jgi:uncharacterized integral membrane protein (TIGR00697 family)
MERAPNSRWYSVVLALFVTSLIISNIIAVKVVSIFGLTLPAAVILFPIAYIVGDVLTEVYGYARARQSIWIAFGCNLLAVLAIWIAGLLPADAQWRAGVFTDPVSSGQAFDAILGFTPRLLLASFSAYLVGEFVNAFIMAKLKLVTRGRLLWTRTIGSTILGQGLDSLIFISLAFSGILPGGVLLGAIISQWGVKTAYEALATPVTYFVINRLKQVEGVDLFDQDTKFTPLRFEP